MICNKCDVKYKVLDVKEDLNTGTVVRLYRCPSCKDVIYTCEETCPSSRYRVVRSNYDYYRRHKDGTQ